MAYFEGYLTEVFSMVKNLAFTLPAVPENVKILRITKRFCSVRARLVLESIF